MIFLTFLTLVLVLLTLAPLLHYQAWWIRVWDFPRLQLAILAAGFMLVCLCFSSQHGQALVLALINAGCAAYQCWWIYPYTSFSPKQVKDHRGYSDALRLRVMVSNVLTPNRQAPRLLAQVQAEQPDVLIALETDRWWQSQLDVLSADYPYSLKCPQDNLYGMHVYSRLPLKDAEIQFLVDDEIPSMHMLVQLDEQTDVRLHCVHPMPPSPTESEESTDRDAELVLVGKSVASAVQPVIVTGDLNDVAWSRTTQLFLKISGLLDPRRGRGMFCTFHAGYPFLRWPLDHVFHSQHFVLASIRRLQNMGSDHFPILIDLVYSPLKGKQQESLEKDAEDEADAQEIMAATESTADEVHAPGEPDTKPVRRVTDAPD